VAQSLTFTKDLADKILAGVSEGKSLRGICQELSLCAPTVRKWIVENHDAFGEHYARARDLQYETWADEIKELADQCRVGTKTVVEESLDGVKTTETTADMVERTRLQIDARKWLLSKLHHKRFGDKLDATLTHEAGDTLTTFLATLRASGTDDTPRPS